MVCVQWLVLLTAVVYPRVVRRMFRLANVSCCLETSWLGYVYYAAPDMKDTRESSAAAPLVARIFGEANSVHYLSTLIPWHVPSDF